MAIHFQCPGEVYAEIDFERIEQVVVNLVENAIKFSDEGTEIEVEVQEYKDDVLVAVKDQGIGISEESLDVIF